ncbi:MAG: Hpt domain-containing protein [Bdellovibrionales bacterium]
MPSLEPELLSRLLPTYIKAREQDLARLRTALNNSDFHVLEKLAHKVKGSAGTYGFEKTAELAERLESAARKQNLEICSAYIETMADLFFKA